MLSESQLERYAGTLQLLIGLGRCNALQCEAHVRTCTTSMPWNRWSVTLCLINRCDHKFILDTSSLLKWHSVGNAETFNKVL